MSGGQLVGIELFTARGLCAFGVEAGDTLRRHLGTGSFPRGERGMLSYDRDMLARQMRRMVSRSGAGTQL